MGVRAFYLYQDVVLVSLLSDRRKYCSNWISLSVFRFDGKTATEVPRDTSRQRVSVIDCIGATRLFVSPRIRSTSSVDDRSFQRHFSTRLSRADQNHAARAPRPTDCRQGCIIGLSAQQLSLAFPIRCGRDIEIRCVTSARISILYLFRYHLVQSMGGGFGFVRRLSGFGLRVGFRYVYDQDAFVFAFSPAISSQ